MVQAIEDTRPLAFRTALALSNMAVSLMQNACFDAALDVLNEAICLVNSTYDMADSSAPVVDPQVMYRLAHKRSRECLPNVNVLFPVNMNVIDEDDFMALRQSATYGPSPTMLFPIRISESFHDPYNASSLEVAQQIAILRYNHGVANFTVSMMSGEGKTGEHLHQSYRSLLIADTILSSLTENISSECIAANLALLLLSATVLNGLSLVFCKQEQMHKFQEAQDAALVLCSNVDRDDHWVNSILTSWDSAAAA